MINYFILYLNFLSLLNLKKPQIKDTMIVLGNTCLSQVVSIYNPNKETVNVAVSCGENILNINISGFSNYQKEIENCSKHCKLLGWKGI